MIDTKFAGLLNAIPEFYQPLYGHDEIQVHPLRICKDRLPIVKKIYDDLSAELQRPLRILDLGCAQGFFSLNVASLGATVTGIDFKDHNVRLCNFLASEHPDFNAKFFVGKIEDFLPSVKNDEYDLVFGMNILHNAAKFIGVQKIQELMADLSRKVKGGIFEFAIENKHRAYITADYRDSLPGFSFIREIAHSEHRDGSGIQRPICFASDKYVWFEKFGMMKIDDIFYNVRGNLRKKDLICFVCGDKFIKFFYVKTQDQLIKAQREFQFLRDFGGQKGLPKLLTIHNEQDKSGIRIFIVRDSFSGVTLSEKIDSGEKIDRWNILDQALQWMVFFEQQGYYHDDVETKNFFCASDGKIYPIDYEEVRREPTVLTWPYNVRLKFLIFMNAVLDERVEQRGFNREVRLLTNLKKHLSPTQYEQIAAIKESEKFFARMYEILFGAKERDTAKATYDLREMEFLSAQQFLDDVSKQLKANENLSGEIVEQVNKLSTYIDDLIQVVAMQQNKIERLEKILRN